MLEENVSLGEEQKFEQQGVTLNPPSDDSDENRRNLKLEIE